MEPFILAIPTFLVLQVKKKEIYVGVAEFLCKQKINFVYTLTTFVIGMRKIRAILIF